VLNARPQFDSLAEAATPDPAEALLAIRPVCLDGRTGFVDTPVYDYRKLKAGHRISGPAIIQVPTTSVVVRAGMSGVIDEYGNLRIKTRETVVELIDKRSAA
jgi:N-methylhydantoinase A